MKILMVLTSHNQLGNTGLPTGFWLEDLRPPISFSGMLALSLRSPPRKAASLRSIQKATCLKIRRQPWRDSKRMRLRKRLSPTRSDYRRKGGRFRNRLLSGWARPHVGSRRRPSFDRSTEAFYNSGKPIALVCHSPGCFVMSPTRAILS